MQWALFRNVKNIQFRNVTYIELGLRRPDRAKLKSLIHQKCITFHWNLLGNFGEDIRRPHPLNALFSFKQNYPPLGDSLHLLTGWHTKRCAEWLHCKHAEHTEISRAPRHSAASLLSPWGTAAHTVTIKFVDKAIDNEPESFIMRWSHQYCYTAHRMQQRRKKKNTCSDYYWAEKWQLHVAIAAHLFVETCPATCHHCRM